MMSDRFSIRDANISDLPEICEVERASFSRDAYPSFLLEKLILNWHSFFFVITNLPGKIVGYCVAKNGQTLSHLISLAVLPNYRGLGVASRMLTELLIRLRKSGVGEVTLEVRPDNDPAIQLYHSFGFTNENMIQGYYSDGSAALRMRKII